MHFDLHGILVDFACVPFFHVLYRNHQDKGKKSVRLQVQELQPQEEPIFLACVVNIVLVLVRSNITELFLFASIVAF